MKIAVLLRAIDDPSLARGFTGSTWRLDDPSLTALDLALTCTDKVGGSVEGLAAGPASWEAALRVAIAAGAGRVRRLWNAELADGDIVAHADVLAASVSPDSRLVLAGSAATGSGSGLLAAALAERLEWPLVQEGASLSPAGHEIVVQVRAPAGRRLELRAPLPCVVACARQPSIPLMPPVRRRILAGLSPIPLESVEAGAWTQRYSFRGYGPARPLTRRLFKPDTSASSGRRLRQLMSGGTGGAKKKALAGEGDLASQVADLLDAEGFII